jgi:phosphoribosylformylglycinamidine cyclo-ligase
VLPEGLGAVVRRGAWEEPRVFAEIMRLGAVDEAEMDQVFNRGIGMVLVVSDSGADAVVRALASAEQPAAVIGEVTEGTGVSFA